MVVCSSSCTTRVRSQKLWTLSALPSGSFSGAEKKTKQVNIITSDCNKSQEEEDKSESRARERWLPRKMTSELRPDGSQGRSHAGCGDKRVPEKISNANALRQACPWCIPGPSGRQRSWGGLSWERVKGQVQTATGASCQRMEDIAGSGWQRSCTSPANCGRGKKRANPA